MREHKGEARAIWLFAVVVALTFHLALAAVAAVRLAQSEAVDFGAPGLEIGLELTAPKAPPIDLPAGPDSDASAAAAPSAQQEENQQPLALPKDTPQETDEPDRLAADTKQDEAKEELKPETPAPPAAPSIASVAQDATATPSIEAARDAETSTTPAPGTGQSRQRLRATWQRELVAHIDKHKRYPAERARLNATIVVDLVLDRRGKVVSAAIAKSSGDETFDAAALGMIRRADPVPAPPPLVADEGLHFTLPVHFKLRERS